MQRGSKFSLAAALFGWPAAPGHSAPSQEVPDAWLLLFGKQHATTDPAVLSGIFTACPAGRDWVLESAPKVTLSIDTTDDRFPTVWLQRCSKLREALTRRGSRPVHLAVMCKDHELGSPHNLAECLMLPSLCFDGAGRAITHLSVTDERSTPYPLHITAPLLVNIAAQTIGSQLTSLTLHPCPQPLPLPQSLPSLQHLDVRLMSGYDYIETIREDIYRSVGSHIPHLTSLTLDDSEYEYPTPWGVMFEAECVTNTLTTLTTDRCLTDELVEFLFEFAPNMARLSVRHISIIDDLGGCEWGVREIEIKCWDDSDTASVFNLPVCKAGPVMVVIGGRCPLDIVVDSAEGLSADIQTRMSNYQFTVDTLSLQACLHRPLPPANHPAALRHTLHQLGQHLHAPGAELSLYGWEWSNAALEQLIAAGPTLGQSGVSVPQIRIDDALTDELLSAAVQLGRRLDRPLAVKSLDLQSDLHVGVAWPWEELWVHDVKVGMLSKLPEPGGEGAPRKVVCTWLMIDDSVTKVGVEGLKSKLQHIQWQTPPPTSQTSGPPSTTPSLPKPMYITLTCPHDTRHAAELLRAQLSVLRAVRFASPEQQKHVQIQLLRWPFTHEVMRAMRGLPCWPCGLRLQDCTWPLPSEQYTQLGQHVPTCIAPWVLGYMAPSNNILAGINTHREDVYLGPYQVKGPATAGRSKDGGAWCSVGADTTLGPE